MAKGVNKWARRTLRGLGIQPNSQNMRALRGWQRAEGGHTHNTARFNYLNTTKDEPGAGNTGSQGNIKVYRSLRQGVKGTVDTLKLPAYGGIRRALRSGSAGDVANAIGASPWGTNPSLVSSAIAGTPSRPVRAGSPVSTPGASTGPRPRLSSVQIGNRTTIDRAGFEQAQRRALLANFLQRSGKGNSVLFRSGLLSTTAPQIGDFTSNQITSRIIQGQGGAGAGSRIPGGTPAKGAVGSAITAARKRLGIHEIGTSNRGREVDAMSKSFGMAGVPWCGIFIGTVLREAGVKGLNSRVASVAAIEQDAKAGANGFHSWHSARHARKGDALVTNSGGHVVFVTGVNRRNGTIRTIGGNSSGAVRRVTYRMSDVVGAARPNYRS